MKLALGTKLSKEWTVEHPTSERSQQNRFLNQRMVHQQIQIPAVETNGLYVVFVVGYAKVFYGGSAYLFPVVGNIISSPVSSAL